MIFNSLIEPKTKTVGIQELATFLAVTPAYNGVINIFLYNLTYNLSFPLFLPLLTLLGFRQDRLHRHKEQ